MQRLPNIVPSCFIFGKAHSDLNEAHCGELTFPETPKQGTKKLTWHLDLLPKSVNFQYSFLNIFKSVSVKLQCQTCQERFQK